MQTEKPHLNSFAAGPESRGWGVEGWEEQPTDSGRGLLEPGGGGGELEFIAQAAGCRHLAGLDGLAFQSGGGGSRGGDGATIASTPLTA